MKKLALFLSLILTVLLFVSCTKKVIFDEKVFFPDANWTFENKAITFEIPFTGSEEPYSIILELDLVGVSNVDKFDATVSIFSPVGGETVKPILFNFSNPQEPYIQGASPNEKTYRLIVYPKKYFPESGTYTFIVDQYSNKADNYGIHALRMYVEKVKEKK